MMSRRRNKKCPGEMLGDKSSSEVSCFSLNIREFDATGYIVR